MSSFLYDILSDDANDLPINIGFFVQFQTVGFDGGEMCVIDEESEELERKRYE